MIRNLTPGDRTFMDRVHSFANTFGAGNGGSSSEGALHTAQAYIYNMMHRQASALAYIDVIRYLTIFCALMLPLLFLIPRPPKGASASAGH